MTQQYKVIENMAEGIRRKKMISLGINGPSHGLVQPLTVQGRTTEVRE